MSKRSGLKTRKTPYQLMTANQRLLYWLLVFQSVSLVFLLSITWVDEELILPNLDRWIPFASPKLIAGLLESFWLILLFALTIRSQINSWHRIKVLEGILPICSYCKKIRDKKGSWNQMEEYVSDKTGADFSHGICPVCMEAHFGDLMHKP
jgi:hypothetical protein